MGNFACELAESSQVIRRRVAEMFEELVIGWPDFPANRARRKGAQELAEQTLMVIEGAVVIGKGVRRPNRIASGLRRFRRTIEARIPESRTATGKVNRGRASSPLQQKEGE